MLDRLYIITKYTNKTVNTTMSSFYNNKYIRKWYTAMASFFAIVFIKTVTSMFLVCADSSLLCKRLFKLNNWKYNTESNWIQTLELKTLKKRNKKKEWMNVHYNESKPEKTLR